MKKPILPLLGLLVLAVQTLAQSPSITSFTATPASILSGQSATLDWSVAGATSLSVNQGVGGVAGVSVAVSPAPTTTYTLTATNASGASLASTTVTVAAPDTYEAWRIAHFSVAERQEVAISGPLADPDRSGLTNLERYAFDLAARGPAVAPAACAISAGGYPTITFSRRTVAPDLTYIVESSPDLATWAPLSPSITAGLPVQVTVSDSVPATSTMRRFLRIRLQLASAPAVPQRVVAVGSDRRVDLTWTPSDGATSYRVKRATTPGGAYVQVGVPTTAAFSDTSATNGTRYWYVVSAVNFLGESGDSAAASATPSASSGLIIPVEHPRLWWTPARLAQARTWYASHPFTPRADDPLGQALRYMLTGESAMAHKGPGARVHAATLNQHGSFPSCYIINSYRNELIFRK